MASVRRRTDPDCFANLAERIEVTCLMIAVMPVLLVELLPVAPQVF
jgi:hypothetical protein